MCSLPPSSWRAVRAWACAALMQPLLAGLALAGPGVGVKLSADLRPLLGGMALLGTSTASLGATPTTPVLLRDAYGHGTHVATTAAGHGTYQSPDASGIAPGAALYDVRMMDARGVGRLADVLAGIDWTIQQARRQSIRVVNLSLGAQSTDSFLLDRLARAARSAVASGLVVVAAAGNFGRAENGTKLYGSISSPGNAPAVISVGASNSRDTTRRDDDAITGVSSRGPTRGGVLRPSGNRWADNLMEPDLVAPGNPAVGGLSSNAVGSVNSWALLARSHPELVMAPGATLPRPESVLAGQPVPWGTLVTAGGNHLVTGEALFRQWQPLWDPALTWARGAALQQEVRWQPATLTVPGRTVPTAILQRNAGRQPLFDLQPHRLNGFESLARWLHPERGATSPGVFIGLAEESGCIQALTAWAIDEAVRQHAAWLRAMPGHAQLVMQVNVSGKDLAQPHFVPHVRDVLQRHGLPPHNLVLEITQSTLMAHREAALAALEALHADGVKVGIDDFGIGDSSLADLSTLPFDCLKIDRSFVIGMDKGPQNLEIVRAVVSLGRTLNKQVVAEGIETHARLHQLRALGATIGQGDLLGRPLTPAKAQALLSEPLLTPA